MEFDTLYTATMFVSTLLPSFFDEDPSHGLSCRGKEVLTIVPMLVLLPIHQSNVGFMHQCRGL